MIEYFINGLKAYTELCKTSIKWMGQCWLLCVMLSAILIVPYIVWVLARYGLLDGLTETVKSGLEKVKKRVTGN